MKLACELSLSSPPLPVFIRFLTVYALHYSPYPASDTQPAVLNRG